MFTQNNICQHDDVDIHLSKFKNFNNFSERESIFLLYTNSIFFQREYEVIRNLSRSNFLIFLKKIFQFYKLAFFVHIHSHIILFLPKFLILKIISNIFVSIENIFLCNKSFSTYEKRSHLKRG